MFCDVRIKPSSANFFYYFNHESHHVLYGRPLKSILFVPQDRTRAHVRRLMPRILKQPLKLSYYVDVIRSDSD